MKISKWFLGVLVTTSLLGISSIIADSITLFEEWAKLKYERQVAERKLKERNARRQITSATRPRQEQANSQTARNPNRIST